MALPMVSLVHIEGFNPLKVNQAIILGRVVALGLQNREGSLRYFDGKVFVSEINCRSQFM